jgi:hypothetical protein
MDIRGWLQGIVADEQRGSLDNLGVAPFLLPKDNGQDQVLKSRKFNCYRASSILDAAQPRSQREVEKTNAKKRPISPPSITQFNDCEPLEDSPSPEEADGSDHHKYTRRLRRKTRPDLYDSKPDSKCNDNQEQPKRKRKKKNLDQGTTSKRLKLSTVSTRARDFHAENVCTERLTVRL